MIIDSLQDLNTYFEILCIFNLAYAGSNRFNEYLNNKIFGLEKKKATITSAAAIEIANIKSENGISIEKEPNGFLNNMVALLERFISAIPQQVQNFQKGFENIYLISGLYGFYLIYHSSLQTSNQVVYKNIIICGGITAILLIFLTLKHLIPRIRTRFNTLYLIAFYVLAILISHFIKVDADKTITKGDLILHLSNIILIFPFIVNMVGALIFKVLLDKDWKKWRTRLNIDEDYAILSGRWD